MQQQTTLINLTAAYASFVNGGKKIEPSLISRIQDRRGKTIFKVKNRECVGCEKFIESSKKYPIISNTNERIFSEETAYQMTSILTRSCRKRYGKKT